MRYLLNSLPKVALAAAALVLLLTAGVLLEGSRAAYDSRDAFAAQVGSRAEVVILESGQAHQF